MKKIGEEVVETMFATMLADKHTGEVHKSPTYEIQKRSHRQSFTRLHFTFSFFENTITSIDLFLEGDLVKRVSSEY